MNDLVAPSEHGRHVERARRRLRGSGDAARLGERLRGPQQRLRGHARVERALPADQLALDERDREAGFCQPSRADLAGRTGAQHDHVELTYLIHDLSLASWSVTARGRAPPPLQQVTGDGPARGGEGGLRVALA